MSSVSSSYYLQTPEGMLDDLHSQYRLVCSEVTSVILLIMGIAAITLSALALSNRIPLETPPILPKMGIVVGSLVSFGALILITGCGVSGSNLLKSVKNLKSTKHIDILKLQPDQQKKILGDLTRIQNIYSEELHDSLKYEKDETKRTELKQEYDNRLKPLKEDLAYFNNQLHINVNS